MPIYEYQCKKCNHIFEELQKVDEGNVNIVCPACKEPHPEKLLSCCNSIGTSQSSSIDSMPSLPSGGPGACGSRGFS